MDSARDLSQIVETILMLPDGTRYAVPPTGLTIGREASNDLVLIDPLVSRRHAHVYYRDGTLYISDLGSYNGTLLNGERITTEQALHDGDVLELGETRLALHIRLPSPSIVVPAVAADAAPAPSAVIALSDAELEVAAEAASVGTPARLVITASGPHQSPAGAAAEITLHGVLDVETADQFRDTTRRLLEDGVVHFTLILQEIDYLDSSGLAALISLLHAVKPHAGTVQLALVQPAVRGVIELTRLDRVFTVQ